MVSERHRQWPRSSVKNQIRFFLPLASPLRASLEECTKRLAARQWAHIPAVWAARGWRMWRVLFWSSKVPEAPVCHVSVEIALSLCMAGGGSMFQFYYVLFACVYFCSIFVLFSSNSLPPCKIKCSCFFLTQSFTDVLILVRSIWNWSIQFVQCSKPFDCWKSSLRFLVAGSVLTWFFQRLWNLSPTFGLDVIWYSRYRECK